jgi:hypothetical protein
MNNLFVSYDLISPGQNYDEVVAAIKSLGSWAKVHYSLWYVKSAHSASKAAEIVRAAQDVNDSLIVIDASNNNAAWYNLKPEVEKHLKEQWHAVVPARLRY